MSTIGSKKWKHKGKIRYQPTQGSLGLYQPKNLLNRITQGRFWGEEHIWRTHQNRDTPALYRTHNGAIRAGRRFKKRHTYTHPEPHPINLEN